METGFICNRPVKEIVVLSDGRITTCCLDPRGVNSFANIFEDDFKQTIDKFQNFKNKMVEDVKQFPVCRSCVQVRKGYYNDFHKFNPSHQEIESYLSMEAFPRQLVIELTAECNMRCSGCISGRKELKGFREMERGLYIDAGKLKDWLSPFIKKIKMIRLFNYGETFLHPKAIEFCDFLTTSNPKIKLVIATNILPLNTDEKIEYLIRTQPNVLYVSLHGANQESVSQYMGGKADFKKALKIMSRVVQLRKKMKYDAPMVVWKYILFEWNDSDEEMQQAIELAKEYDVDYFGFEITSGDIASKRFSPGSDELNKLRKSEYFMQSIYKKIFQKTLERKFTKC